MEINNTEGEPLSVEMFNRIIANPFYCMTVDQNMSIPHEPLVSEETWIQAGVKSIEQDGDNGRKFLTNLLENLKGNYVS